MALAEVNSCVNQQTCHTRTNSEMKGKLKNRCLPANAVPTFVGHNVHCRLLIVPCSLDYWCQLCTPVGLTIVKSQAPTQRKNNPDGSNAQKRKKTEENEEKPGLGIVGYWWPFLPPKRLIC